MKTWNRILIGLAATQSIVTTALAVTLSPMAAVTGFSAAVLWLLCD